MVGEFMYRLAFPVRRGAEIEHHAFAAQALDDLGVACADHTVGDALHAELESVLHVLWLPRLPGVACEVQTGGPGGLECGALPGGGIAHLVTCQVKTHDASARKLSCFAGELDVF